MDPRAVLGECKGNWKPPAEFEYSRPREYRLTGAGRALLAFSILLLVSAIAAGVVLHLKASSDHRERQAVAERGLDSSAEVTRRWSTRGKDAKYWIEYEYSVGGQQYKYKMEPGRNRWSRLKEGSVLPVRYLSENPRSHFIPGLEEQLMPLWVPYLIAALLAAISWLSHYPLSRQRHLLQEGRPAPAVITEHKKTKDGKIAHYSFLQFSGSIGTGHMSPQKNPPEVGSLVCVLYEPDRAKNNAKYPLALVCSPHAPRRGNKVSTRRP